MKKLTGPIICIIVVFVLVGLCMVSSKQKQDYRQGVVEKRIAQKEALLEQKEQTNNAFVANKNQIILSINSIISDDDYHLALERLDEYSEVQDKDLDKLRIFVVTKINEINKSKETKEILTKLKTIPMKEYKQNLDLYKRLLEFYPNDEKYKTKVAFYSIKRNILQNKINREKMIQKQFSDYDGRHILLDYYLKSVMHDPGSYEHYSTVYYDKDYHLIVKTVIRGKNAFGALILSTVTAKISIDGEILNVNW